MQNNQIIVQVKASADTVFEFTTNPQNTPKWLDQFEYEETNEWPVKVGTKYRNKTTVGKWGGYVVVACEQNKLFEILADDNNYHTRYGYKSLGENETELDYTEWVDRGDIECPFTPAMLEKLKKCVENL